MPNLSDAVLKRGPRDVGAVKRGLFDVVAGGGGGGQPEGWSYKWDAADLSGVGDGNVISADWGQEAPVSPTGSPVYRDTALDGNPAVEFDGSSYFRGSSTDAALPQPYCFFIALQIPSGDTGKTPFEWNKDVPTSYFDHFTGSGRVAGTFRLGSSTLQNLPDGPHNDAAPHAFAAILSGANSEFSHVGGATSTPNPGVNAFGGTEELVIGGGFNTATPPDVLQLLAAGSLLGEILVYDATDLTNAGEILTSLKDYALAKYPSLAP